MAKVVVHAGDFKKGNQQASFGSFTLKTEKHSWVGEVIPFSELAEVDVASEEAVKRLGGTVGWGVAGAVLLGPVGLLAGLIAGGKGKNTTFVARFNDGRKLLATTDAKTYTKMVAAIF